MSNSSLSYASFFPSSAASPLVSSRFELKYVIHLFDYHLLRSKLRHLLHSDPYADDTGAYHVRSLYFDDFFDTDFYDKQDGIRDRKKYRIRLYNLDDSFIRLEKKIKHGHLIAKHACGISKEECTRLISCQIPDYISETSQSTQPLLTDVRLRIRDRGLRPKVVVDYIREAYVYPTNNVRITFDRFLKTGFSHDDLTDPDLPTGSLYPDNMMIMEIKFHHFLPDFIRNIIQLGVREQKTVSKYAMCRMFQN